MKMAYQPSQVFASFTPQTEETKHLPSNVQKGNKLVREVQVSSTGESFLAPDRATVQVVVTSSKDSIGDVKSSTTRRLDYIIQTLHTHNVKVVVHLLYLLYFIFCQTKIKSTQTQSDPRGTKASLSFFTAKTRSKMFATRQDPFFRRQVSVSCQCHHFIIRYEMRFLFVCN